MKNLIVILFFLPLLTAAQTTHTVAPKESLYSLGRLYNIHPKELAAYNNISIETGLTIGQVIRIPAKATSAPVKNLPPLAKEPVSKNAEPDQSFNRTPLYHKVEKKETLYHISKLYNNVSIEDIRKWNNLAGDGLNEGANLIVGYKNEPRVNQPVTVSKNNFPETKTEVEPQKQNTVKEKNIVTESPVVVSPKVVAKSPEHVKQVANKVTGKNFNGGYFRPVYDGQVENKKVTEETGTAAIFKSTSGWEDGKYYCLHNTAPAGSIMKITNTLTQKSVYAKVLDVIPDLRQNSGITLRLSNAAADELGAGESNFAAVLNY